MVNEYRTEIPLDHGMKWIIQTYPFDGGIREIEYATEACHEIKERYLLDQNKRG